MIEKAKILIAAVGIAFFAGLTPVAVSAQSVFDAGCDARPNSPVCQQTGGAENKTRDFIQNIITLLLYVLGVIAVIAIIVGGIRYATANGDSSQISSAKNTILYAVVGLVAALLSYAIVNFVLASF